MSTKSPSFCKAAFGASLTKLTVRLPQSRDPSYYVSRQHWLLNRSVRRNTPIHAHTNSRRLPTCDVN